MFLVVDEKSDIDCNYSENSKTKWKAKFLNEFTNKSNLTQEEIEQLDVTSLDFVSLLRVKSISDDGDTKCKIVIFKKTEDNNYLPVFNGNYSEDGDDDVIETDRAIEAFAEIGESLSRMMKVSKVSTPIIFLNHYKYIDNTLNSSTTNKNFKDRGYFPDYKFCANKLDSVLFEENEQGEIIISGVVETQLNKDEILNEVAGWLKELKQKDIIDINDEAQRQNSYSCLVELGIGKVGISWSVWGATVASTTKNKSEVKFNFKIDAKDNRYRYTLSEFYTERLRVSGSAKEHGQSNEIHFHRLMHIGGNDQKADEKIQYREERAAVDDFIKSLKENIGVV